MKKIPYGSIQKKKYSKNLYWQYYDEDLRYQRVISLRTDNYDDAFKIAFDLSLQYLLRKKQEINEGEKISLRFVALRFMESRRRGSVKKRTLQSYKSHIYGDLGILTFFGLETPPWEIKSRRINEYRNFLSDNNLSGRSINHMLSTLSGLLKYCAQNEWIDSIPYIQRDREDYRKKGEIISSEKMDFMIDCARSISIDLLLLVVLCRFSGLRSSEACSLEWEKIDFKSGWISLVDQKNNTEMPAPILGSEKFLLEIPPENRIGKVIRWNSRCVTSLRKEWNICKKMCNLKPEFKFHWLRHTFITEIENSRALSPGELSLLARHKSLQSTQAYIHAWKNDVLEKIKSSL